MENKKTPNGHEMLQAYKKYLTLLVLFIYAVVCICAFNTIKMGVGLIAQMFENMIVHFTMFSSYLLPLICFGFFFFGGFVKPNRKITKIIYTIVVAGLAIYNIVGLAINFDVFMANNQAGFYVNLQTFGISFPIDVLIINIFILLLQCFNIYLLIKPGAKYAYIKDAFCSYGFFKFNIFESIIVAILGVLTSIFIGDFFNGLNTLENASIDGKYVFLLIFILVIPLMNFVYFLTKPQSRNLQEKNKAILYGVNIGVNILLVTLFISFVFTYEDFVADIGRNLFPVDYTLSIPFGPYILLIIAIISIVYGTIHLIKSLIKMKASAE